MGEVLSEGSASEVSAEVSLDSFEGQFRMMLEKLYSRRGLIFIFGSLVIEFLMYILVFIIGNIAESYGYVVRISMGTAFMMPIPLLITFAAVVVASEKGGTLKLSGIPALAGRFLGAVATVVFLMMPAFVMIFVGQTIHGYNFQVSVLYAYFMVAVYVAIVVAVTMIINTRSEHSAALSFLVVFVVLPAIVFIFGPLSGLVDIDTLYSVIPLPDMVAAMNANSFGGLTVLSILTILKSAPGVDVDPLACFILCLGWAVFLFSIVLFVCYRRDSE